MSERNDDLLINDIKESINKILLYTNSMSEDDFLTDQKTQDAVARNFEIIGEACSRISESGKSKFPQIEWRLMKDFRNKIIHDYFGTDYRMVWVIVNNQIPSLKNKLEAIS
jgi:uncharacterized protein with HEPN domain